MTLKIVRVVDQDSVVFTLSGRLDTEHAVELQAAFDTETLAIVVDLGEVRRVDREVVPTLARWSKGGVKLENCPGYLRDWIAKSGGKRGP